MKRSLGLFVLTCSLASACAAREDVLVRLEAPVPGHISIGAYFVDGTSLDDQSNSVIWNLAHASNPEFIRVARYYRGPAVLCDQDGLLSCRERTEKVHTAICDDVIQGRTESYVVFGFSRGVWIANKAASTANTACGGAARRYLYGGFLDGVMQSKYLRDARVVPYGTLWHHLFRNRPSDWLYPNTRLESELGEGGEHETTTPLSHQVLGKSARMLASMKAAANSKTGLALFQP
jgi:hypothetical protein